MSSSNKNDQFIVHFSKRLREERERLDLTQVQAADLCGVARNSWGGYERGKNMPGADIIARFTAIGADANYLMTGKRTGLICEPNAHYHVKRDIAALIDNLEHCSKEDQDAIKQMALSLARANKDDFQETERKKASNEGE